jgi:alpha-1,2-mannosyltransferase
VRQRLSRTFGLRSLLEPRLQGAALAVVTVIVVAFRATQFAALTRGPQFGYDLSAYWLAGRHLLDGAPIYTAAQLAGTYAPQGQGLYLYPPIVAALFAPVAWLFPDGYTSLAWLWAALGAAILAAVVTWVARTEGLASGRRGLLLLLAAAFAFPPVLGELVLGNVHLELLGLFTLAWWGVRRGDRRGEAVAGLVIGLAVLVKVVPVVVIVWFLATGRHRAVAWAVLGAFAMAAASLPFTGAGPWLDYPAVLAHLGRPADATDALAPTVWLADLVGSGAARLIVPAAALVVIAWSARRLAAPASYAMAVAMAVLVAPALFHHYLAMLVLPMLLAFAASERRGWLGLVYLAMWGGEQPALGALGWLVNRALPAAGALLLPVGLALRGRRAPGGASPRRPDTTD